MSGRQPGAIPFGEDWVRFALRKNDARRLAFFDTFLKMSQGWIPSDDATEEELDDYDRMDRLLSAYCNGKKGGRPKKGELNLEAPTETSTETPTETPLETKKEGRKERKKDLEGTSTAQTRVKQPPTIDQFKAMAATAGVPEDFAVYLHAELESVSWTTANGSCVANPIRYLKSAWNAEQKKILAARVSGDDAFGGISIAR